MIVLIMGVAGSGKTTVGGLLARQLGWSFADADDFHSAANKAKMAAGRPLDDLDREPWLRALRQHIEGFLRRDESAVIACSALKARYRAILAPGGEDIRWVHLHGPPELLRARLRERSAHYMGPGMLDSQLAALELPAGVFTFDVTASPEELVTRIRQELHL